MWLYRRMLRISWKEHKTNGEVLHQMKTERSLLTIIKKRKCQYFAHIIEGNGVQRLLMEGRINGRRGRGRPRTMSTDNIKEWTKISCNDCIRVAQDREGWRSMRADLLTTDGIWWWWCWGYWRYRILIDWYEMMVCHDCHSDLSQVTNTYINKQQIKEA